MYPAEDITSGIILKKWMNASHYNLQIFAGFCNLLFHVEQNFNDFYNKRYAGLFNIV